MPILGTVFTALTGPIGIVLGVLAGLAVAFTIAYKKSETFRNFVNGAIESVKQTFSNFIQFIQPFIDSVKNIFKQAISAIVDFAKDIWNQINGFLMKMELPLFKHFKIYTILLKQYLNLF